MTSKLNYALKELPDSVQGYFKTNYPNLYLDKDSTNYKVNVRFDYNAGNLLLVGFCVKELNGTVIDSLVVLFKKQPLDLDTPVTWVHYKTLSVANYEGGQVLLYTSYVRIYISEDREATYELVGDEWVFSKTTPWLPYAEDISQECIQCHYHREKVIDSNKKIYCHRVLHSQPGQIDALGYYPLVAAISKDGNMWAVGTCSFYKLSEKGLRND